MLKLYDVYEHPTKGRVMVTDVQYCRINPACDRSFECRPIDEDGNVNLYDDNVFEVHIAGWKKLPVKVEIHVEFKDKWDEGK